MNPESIQSSLQKVVQLHRQGKLPEARLGYEKVLSENPEHRDAMHLLGVLHLDSGDVVEAISWIEKSLKGMEDAFAMPWYHLGKAYRIDGDADRAENCWRKALDVQGDLVNAHQDLGKLLEEEGRWEEALACLQEGVDATGNRELRYNLSVMNYKQGRLKEAHYQLELLLRDESDDVDAQALMGGVCQHMNRHGEARDHLEHALDLEPEHVESLNQMGRLMRKADDLDAAEDFFRRTLRVDREHRDARFQLGVLHLAQGKLSQGFRHYAHRNDSDLGAGHIKPEWQGLCRDLKEEGLCFIPEQGLGDEIFFLRFIQPLKNAGAKITYHCPAKLYPILKDHPLLDEVLVHEPGRSIASFHCLADLPVWLGIEKVSQAAKPIGLKASANKAQLTHEDRPLVGVTWRGGVRGTTSLFKEIPLEVVVSCINAIQADAVVLQRNPEAGELATLESQIHGRVIDLSEANENLEDMLRILCELDEYWGVSNTNVHLAASLNAPCRVWVCWPPEWRWMSKGDQSPWYPGIPLYRQETSGAWNLAMQKFKADILEAFKRS